MICVGLCLTSYQQLRSYDGATVQSLIRQTGEVGMEPTTNGLQGMWFIHYNIVASLSQLVCMPGSRGGRWGMGSRPPLKNYKKLGFLAILVGISCKITKLPSQYSMLGHHWHASERPFKWLFAGGLMMAHL